MKKRGQSGSNAAILVTIIAALLILYILFLPPEERANLLAEDSEYGPGGGPGGPAAVYEVLLQENVGRLDSLTTNEITHSVPSFTISTTTQSAELKKIDSVYVKHSVFDETIKNISFEIDPFLEHELMLSFNVEQADGRLQIFLNNNLIVDKELKEGTPNPFELGHDYLRRENNLVFKAHTPGIAFWRINEYQLSNILITAEVTDISRSFAEQHFSMKDNELINNEKIELRFFPRCDPKEVAPLFLRVNSQVLFSGVADCGVLNSIEIGPEVLNLGDNTISFSADYGTYLIDRVSVITKLKKPEVPVYYFNIPLHFIDYLDLGQGQAVLSLMFVDEQTTKRGTVTVNGYTSSFNTQSITYAVDISRYIKEGSNSIVIKPLVSGIDVAELKVVLR